MKKFPTEIPKTCGECKQADTSMPTNVSWEECQGKLCCSGMRRLVDPNETPPQWCPIKFYLEELK